MDLGYDQVVRVLYNHEIGYIISNTISIIYSRYLMLSDKRNQNKDRFGLKL